MPRRPGPNETVCPPFRVSPTGASVTGPVRRQGACMMDIRRRVGARRAMRLIVAAHRRGLRRIRLPGMDARGRHGGRGLRRSGRRTKVSLARKGRVWVVNRDRGELADLRRRHRNVLATLAGGRGRARHLHLRAGRQGLHHRRDDQHRHDGRHSRRWPRSRSRWARCRTIIEPSHDGRTIYVTLASHSRRRRGAAVSRPSTPTTNSRQLRDHQRQPGGTIAWTVPSLDGETLYVAHDIGDGSPPSTSRPA